MSKSIVSTFLLLAVFTNFISWRFFDGCMVALLLTILLSKPWPIKNVASIFKKSGFLHLMIIVLLSIIFISYILAGMPSEILNFRWLLGAYIIFLATYFIGANDGISLKYLFITLILAAGIAIIYDGLIMNTARVAFNPDHRFQGFFNNSNVFGMAAGLWTSFCLTWIGSQIYFKKKISIWAIITAFLFLGTTYLTYSRSSWGGLVISVTLLFITLRKNRRILFSALACVAVVILMFSTNAFHFRDRLLYTQNLNSSSSNAIRLQIWKANIKMFSEKPFFGVGYWQNTQLLKTYGTDIPFGDQQAHAHNQYLQFLSGTGVLGLTAYLILCVYGLMCLYRKFRSSNDILTKQFALCALMVLITYLIESFTDSPMDSREVRNIMMLIIGGLLGAIFSRKYVNDANAEIG